MRSLGRKNVKVCVPAHGGLRAQEIALQPEKLFFAPDEVALAWKTWKGVNGRGGYRLDPHAYPDECRPVSQWPAGTYVKKSVPPEGQAAPRQLKMSR